MDVEAVTAADGIHRSKRETVERSRAGQNGMPALHPKAAVKADMKADASSINDLSEL